MIDVTLENFETEVIAASHQVPVLVDFLGALVRPLQDAGTRCLEKVEADYGGRFKLVKIDSDQEQQLAQAFRHPQHSYLRIDDQWQACRWLHGRGAREQAQGISGQARAHPRKCWRQKPMWRMPSPWLKPATPVRPCKSCTKR